MSEKTYDPEDMHNSPCQYAANSMTLIKWCLGLIVTLGAFGIGVSLQSSEKAKDKADQAVTIAIEAKDKTAKIEVLAADVRNIQEDVSELKELSKVINQMSREMSKIAANQESLDNKIDYLRRYDDGE